MKIRGNKLEGVPYQASPNVSGEFQNDLPDTIIIHYTGGSSAQSAVSTLTNPNARASAHIVIGQNAEIIQLVPFNVIAWHAGKSAYNGRENLNKYSIGIEIDNAGPLTLKNGKYKSWFGKSYPENEVVTARHKNGGKYLYWHKFTALQVEAVKNLSVLLKENYNIQTILGHDDISPGRKSDPGPAYPMIELLDYVFPEVINEPERREDRSGDTLDKNIEREVIANALNFRSGAGASFHTITEPLRKGTRVIVISENNGWSKIQVQTNIEGWVSSNYLK